MMRLHSKTKHKSNTCVQQRFAPGVWTEAKSTTFQKHILNIEEIAKIWLKKSRVLWSDPSGVCHHFPSESQDNAFVKRFSTPPKGIPSFSPFFYAHIKPISNPFAPFYCLDIPVLMKRKKHISSEEIRLHERQQSSISSVSGASSRMSNRSYRHSARAVTHSEINVTWSVSCVCACLSQTSSVLAVRLFTGYISFLRSVKHLPSEHQSWQHNCSHIPCYYSC